MRHSIRNFYYNKYSRLLGTTFVSIMGGFVTYSYINPPNLYESIVCNSANLIIKASDPTKKVDCKEIDKSLKESTEFSQRTLGIIGFSTIWFGVFGTIVTLHSAYETKPKDLQGFKIKSGEFSKSAKLFVFNFALVMKDNDLITKGKRYSKYRLF
jgi:hypothetical protein